MSRMLEGVFESAEAEEMICLEIASMTKSLSSSLLLEVMVDRNG